MGQCLARRSHVPLIPLLIAPVLNIPRVCPSCLDPLDLVVGLVLLRFGFSSLLLSVPLSYWITRLLLRLLRLFLLLVWWFRSAYQLVLIGQVDLLWWLLFFLVLPFPHTLPTTGSYLVGRQIPPTISEFQLIAPKP